MELLRKELPRLVGARVLLPFGPTGPEQEFHPGGVEAVCGCREFNEPHLEIRFMMVKGDVRSSTTSKRIRFYRLFRLRTSRRPA